MARGSRTDDDRRRGWPQALTLAGASAIGFGDPELAARKADETRRLALELGDAGAVAEAAWACSLAAHARGELRASLRSELDPRRAPPGLATRVFDGYLCASERLLHGALPYGEVIAFADSLAAEAERRDAARGVGFAIDPASDGEAALAGASTRPIGT